jgi:hypothetical protein
VHDSTTCALYNKIENTGAETAVGSNPMASQCNKGNHVVTGEVFLLDIGLLMGVTIERNDYLKFTPYYVHKAWGKCGHITLNCV